MLWAIEGIAVLVSEMSRVTRTPPISTASSAAGRTRTVDLSAPVPHSLQLDVGRLDDSRIPLALRLAECRERGGRVAHPLGRDFGQPCLDLRQSQRLGHF